MHALTCATLLPRGSALDDIPTSTRSGNPSRSSAYGLGTRHSRSSARRHAKIRFTTLSRRVRCRKRRTHSRRPPSRIPSRRRMNQILADHSRPNRVIDHWAACGASAHTEEAIRLHPTPCRSSMRAAIKSTGRLPVANLPPCGKVEPDEIGDEAQSFVTCARTAGARPLFSRAVLFPSPG